MLAYALKPLAHWELKEPETYSWCGACCQGLRDVIYLTWSALDMSLGLVVRSCYDPK